MSYTSHTSYEVKSFIKAFDFPNPSWENLPVGFPNLNREGLTKEERCLLDAIALAWLTGTPAGKKRLFARVAKSATFVLISLITLISLTALITHPSEGGILKNVNAAATISATLKYFNLEGGGK